MKSETIKIWNKVSKYLIDLGVKKDILSIKALEEITKENMERFDNYREKNV